MLNNTLLLIVFGGLLPGKKSHKNLLINGCIHPVSSNSMINVVMNNMVVLVMKIIVLVVKTSMVTLVRTFVVFLAICDITNIVMTIRVLL